MRTGTGLKVGRTDDHRNRVIAEGIAEHHEPRAHTGAEWHEGLAGDGERLRGLLAETRHRAGVDGDDGRIVGIHDRRGGLGHQHRGQHLRELDEIDGRRCRRSRRLRHEHMVGGGVGDERQDHVGVDVGHQFERDRVVGIDAERACPQAG